jgi:hypothetical protein
VCRLRVEIRTRRGKGATQGIVEYVEAEVEE